MVTIFFLNSHPVLLNDSGLGKNPIWLMLVSQCIFPLCFAVCQIALYPYNVLACVDFHVLQYTYDDSASKVALTKTKIHLIWCIVIVRTSNLKLFCKVQALIPKQKIHNVKDLNVTIIMIITGAEFFLLFCLSLAQLHLGRLNRNIWLKLSIWTY